MRGLFYSSIYDGIEFVDQLTYFMAVGIEGHAARTSIHMLRKLSLFTSTVIRGSRQSDIPWRAARAPFHLKFETAPFQIRKRHASKCQRHSLLINAHILWHAM